MPICCADVLAGDGDCPAGKLVEDSFEHYAVSAYVSSHSSCPEMEIVEGKTLTGFTSTSDRLGHPHGVMFNLFEGEEATALEGKVLLRMRVSHSYALGVGVGTKDLPVNKDPEYQAGFFGIYHGGSSRNCCAKAGRYHTVSGSKWEDPRLAVLIDIEERTMQCFSGTKPFGPLCTDLPREALWPVIVVWRPSDVVNLSITSI